MKVPTILLPLLAFAVISWAQSVMSNETVEAMLRGGVPVQTIVTAIRTAGHIQLFMSKDFSDRLLKAGASPAVADQIMQAMHDRNYYGARRPEDIEPVPATVAPAPQAAVSAPIAPPVHTAAPVAVPISAPAASAISAVAPITPAHESEAHPSEPVKSSSDGAGAMIAGRAAVEERLSAACPIEIKQIHPHWIFGSGDPWGSYLLIVFTNNSTKTIAAVRFGVAFVDALGDTHNSVYSYDSDSTVKPGKSSKPEWTDGVYAGELGHKVGAIVWVEKLRFADDTFFVDDGGHTCGAHTK